MGKSCILWMRQHVVVVAAAMALVSGGGWGYWQAYLPARHFIAETRRLQNILGAQTPATHLQMLAKALPTVVATTGQMRRTLRQLDWLHEVPGISARYDSGRHLVRGLNDISRAMQKGMRIAGGNMGSAVTPHVIARVLAHWQKADRSVLPLLAAGLREWDAVDPGYLPSMTFQGRKIPWATVQDILGRATTLLSRANRHAAVLNTLWGMGKPARYLLLFQNSGELRATGGFLTAYAQLTVTRGKLQWGTAHNIYSLDPAVTYRLPAPARFHHYFPFMNDWQIQDANLSPDVPQSVSNFLRFYQSMPQAPRPRGIIWVNSWLRDALLRDVGSLTLTGPKGKVRITPTNANYEMEYLAEHSGLPQSTRKAFLGVLLHTVVRRVLRADGSQLLKVGHTIVSALQQKNLLLYFPNATAEHWVAALNWGGIIPRHLSGDYLQVVNENLDAHKDNYYLTQQVSTRIARSGPHQYVETTRIRWTLPAVANGWLVVPYTGWIRLYVPQGSRLLSLKGPGTKQTAVSANPVLGKTVFSANIRLPAQASPTAPVPTETMTVRYLLPTGMTPQRLVVQKQPGIYQQILRVQNGSARGQWTQRTDLAITAGTRPSTLKAAPWSPLTLWKTAVSAVRQPSPGTNARG